MVINHVNWEPFDCSWLSIRPKIYWVTNLGVKGLMDYIAGFEDENIPWTRKLEMNDQLNPLTVEFFFIPFRSTKIIFYKPSPGTEFFQCLVFGTDFFFGTHVYWVKTWSIALSTVQDNCIYTIFKAVNQEIQFPLYMY